jgi:DNA-binding CsgD family transcriptional regulator
MPAPQALETATLQTPPFSDLDHEVAAGDADACVFFFAVRSPRAQDAIETIKTVLPPGSLLYTRRGGAWRSLEALLDGRSILSARQAEILEHLASNKSNKEIGRAMALSHFTVRNHISQLMRLFDVSTRGALASVWAAMARQAAC